VTLHHSLPVFTLAWPADAQVAGRNLLTLRVEHTMSPQRAGIGRDPRELGVGLRSIAVLEAGATWLPPRLRGGALVRNPPPPTATAAEGNQDAVVVTAPGDVVWWGHGYRLSEHVLRISPATAEVAFHALGTHGDTVPLASSRAVHEASAEHRDFVPTSATDLSDHTFLVARVEASSDAPVTLQLRRERLSRNRWSSAPPAVTQNLNVVVVILDAARPDRFGCYGGPRPTTPAIDTLANESRIYHNVFALVPYTLCSVPTMLTGLSFLDHEVVAPENRLADEATTLAETLSGAGYATAAFSSTPNNSRAKGFDQGYDVFHEDWSDGERRLPIDPHRLVSHAVAWLEQADEGRPFHLLVHMVPPHEPYQPGPEFDHFSDPGYSGAVDGDLPWNVAFNNAATTADEADRRHLVDLYDGNLLRADDATGRLLGALRSRTDWDRTVVLVTSDHGEALTEHGLIGHNAAVYDEMLRVPFILRIPGDTARTEDRRLGALTDLAPTLLSAAGFDVRSGDDARSLLDPDPGLPRVLILRTSHKHPTWGVRTDRHKLIHRGSAASELFDLEHDPRETDSVIDDHRLLAAALRQVMSDCRLREPLFRADDASNIDAEDRQMLEALGYVD
jgi:arylsulfatase A-like enzyme